MLPRLRETTGATLGAQLWQGGQKPPSAARFTPARNDARNISARKPLHGTGLWTSTLYDLGGVPWSEWLGYSVSRDVEPPDDIAARIWIVAPRADARLLEVDDVADVVALLRRFPLPCPTRAIERTSVAHARFGVLTDARFLGEELEFVTLDYERMAEEGIDGVHLTSRGRHATHLTFPAGLYGWDCECTIWLRWALDEASARGWVDAVATERDGDDRADAPG